MPVELTEAARPDLTRCDQEPIHIPGLIQPHGVLLVLDECGVIQQCTANVSEHLGMEVDAALGQPLERILGAEAVEIVQTGSDPRVENNPVYLETIRVADRLFDVLLHKRSGMLLLELEIARADDGKGMSKPYPLLRRVLAELQQDLPVQELLNEAAAEMRALTGFDRVLIYQFGPDWTGTVIAEARNEVLPSYMELRFPESDIPKQARELYRLNRVRLIADANYTPVPLLPMFHPQTSKSTDLTYSHLRSVSPVHLEYMRNMGTLASMSVSILRDGQLWGLFACHHHAPCRVPAQVRFAAELLAHVLSAQVAASGERANSIRREELLVAQRRLLAGIGEAESFVDALEASPEDLLGCVGADGAAVVFENRCVLIKKTPDEQHVRELAEFVSSQSEQDVTTTNELRAFYPPCQKHCEDASGMIAANISEYGTGYIFWFRQEKSRTTKWAGNPNKIEVALDGRIHPRRSFQMWTEREHGKAQPWTPVEVDAARGFRSAIVSLVLRKAQKLASLSADLQRSNAELEAFSYSVSHDLRAPFRHIIGYAELLRESERVEGEDRRYVETIIESANFAGSLVDNLLNFSQIGRSKLNLGSVPLKQVAEELVQSISAESPDRKIQWKVDELPTATVDLFLLRLALANLIRNAVKYTRGRPEAIVEIGSYQDSTEHVVFVRDNGVGFDMQFSDKLFGVFQRLHRMEDFEGTGIGLASVRRIIGRHGGRTWAEGQEGKGATFFFSLPKAPREV